MKCPYCGVSALFNWTTAPIVAANTYTTRHWRAAYCPDEECCQLVVHLGHEPGDEEEVGGEIEWSMIEPVGSSRGPVPAIVPSNVATDYVEACRVLPVSPKASAALARRCLQAILRAHGYSARDLATEVQLLLDESDASRAIPGSLRMMVDAVRNFGNFSAHPITDVTTLQVIDVEPEEAEWCLEVIEECFQHFYVRPAEAAARKAALDAKLAKAGKPASKG